MGFLKKLTDKAKDVVSSYVIYTATGGFFGGGEDIFAAGSGHKGRKYGKDAYDVYTGHTGRQQKRIAQEEKERQEQEIEYQKKYALAQRKVQIDAQRERTGVGSRYRTSTRNKTEMRGGVAKRETLG